MAFLGENTKRKSLFFLFKSLVITFSWDFSAFLL
uniref:Uncharacterized protein n=1 Tax=Arundo donax TaxID=35708 RepID=A0A0A9AUJ8_ARUDO